MLRTFIQVLAVKLLPLEILVCNNGQECDYYNFSKQNVIKVCVKRLNVNTPPILFGIVKLFTYHDVVVVIR